MAKEKISGIYKITSPSGKVYIGQSLDCVNRWRCYKRLNCKEQRLLYNSFIKYGVENHFFEMVVVLDKSLFDKKSLVNELNRLESYYIDFFNSFSDRLKSGLNLTKGGDSREMSNESKLRLSESHKGKKLTKEHREKISIGGTGRVHSEESKNKMSESQKGRIVSPEAREKLRLANLGKIPSEDTRKKISDKTSGENNYMYGKKHSDETKKKQSEKKKGKKASQSTKLKMSESRKGEKHYLFGKNMPLETRKKISDSQKGEKSARYGKKNTREHNEAISKAQKGKIVSEETRSKQSKAKKGNPLPTSTLEKFRDGRRKGKNNPMYGKTRVISKETILKREATRKRNRELIEEEKRMMIF